MCVGGRFGVIVNFLQIADKLYTLVRFFTQIDNLFLYPCELRKVGIVKCTGTCDELEAVDLSVAEKCLAFPISD